MAMAVSIRLHSACAWDSPRSFPSARPLQRESYYANSLPVQSTFHCRRLSASSFKKDEQDFKGEHGGRQREETVDDEELDEDAEEEESNLELLFRIATIMIRRVSKRATKAARDLLPPMISSQMVTFSVNGIVILASLWVLKALLEIACIVGSVIFIGLLVMRGVWSTISYFHLSDKQDYSTLI